ncbi:imidazolonepropionase [Alkalimonas amylolytica]|uniref:Imidazolonepropionase n=1 Tax=Alkalimonas amylolytica TaxID=152573 RepID=A0A1H3Y1S2_ALKAM|nr:imidazolonepropionase [Alkalimonas amylolytica]SEA04804.1 imidazolonepropionase [Alkalimonas amylolytica]
MTEFDAVWLNANLATMQTELGPYGAIENGALAVKDGRIAWLGPQSALPVFDTSCAAVYDAGGQWLLPGLIDCHTHLIYGGSRANEFELRLHGASYQAIAKAGGGIRSTVQATRQATEQQLFELGQRRLDTLLAQGVTEVEIKSGYGLDLATERKMLRVARALDKQHPIRIHTTFLGAHALPPEFADSDAYMDYLCQSMLPELHHQGLIDAVDVFCEGIGFSVAQSRRLFETARALGLPVKAHAEQLSNLGGSALVAEFGGLSADHVEYLDEAGVQAMAQAGTVAVLLPGAYYFLKETQQPPIALLRQYQVPMAVATDLNPGTSPFCNLPLMLNMACTLFGLTPEEALLGVTRHAAKALALFDVGTLAVGSRANFACYAMEQPAELVYQQGVDPLEQLVIAGQPIQL